MNRRILLAFALVLLFGCSQQTTTNRILRNRPTVTVVVPGDVPLAVGISQLHQAPEAYKDVLVRVTGQYRRAPIIICDGIVRRSPASWRLGSDDQLVAVSGFDDLVPVLLPPGMTVTIDGVWRTWRGPVGCGKDAPLQTVWYLAVTEVVSPSPIARVTLTPPGGVPEATPGEVVEVPQETETPSAPPPVGTPATAPTATRASATASPTTRPPATATGGATSPAPSSPTPSDDEEEETPEATGSPQATATTNGTMTATSAVTATATTGATATPGGTIVDKGSIGYQALLGDRLPVGETDSWQFAVESGDVITISVAARTDTDIVLAVLDPAGNRIIEQNDSPAGQIEIIEGFEATGSGGYRLVIFEEDGLETYYSLMLLNDGYEGDYYENVFAGLLSYGSSATSNMAPDTDHYWFFFGEAGEIVNISVTPSDQSDLFFDLFGPDGDAVWEYVDESRSGGAEQLRDLQLPDTGLYAIHIGEIEYAASSFRVLVSRN